MPAVTLIIHGWSDCSESFANAKSYLEKMSIGTVETIFFADYESREDNITYNDIIDGLNDKMIEKGFIDKDGRKLSELNVIVHSTGGLVIRHWIWRYYRDRINECPVKRLVMLAPANFGSPIAHRGKSFTGRLVKGRWKIGDLWETGRQLLNGLELASPYQWELAHRDLIVKQPYYNAEQIQTTILVGIEDYEGLRSWVNKPGTDGTVVIAGTSLDSAKLTLDFIEASEKMPYKWARTDPFEEIGFGVLKGLNHGSIVENIGKDAGNIQGGINELLRAALSTEKADHFKEYIARLNSVTEEAYRETGKDKYQQFILHAVDDQDVSIRDYTLEFFVFKADHRVENRVVKQDELSETESDLSQEAHEIITREFHTHTVDPSYRRLLINTKEINECLQRAKQELVTDIVLSVRMYVPKIDKGIQYDNDNLQNIVLYDSREKESKSPQFICDNTTTLIELKVDRFNNYVSIGKEPSEH